MRQNRVKTDTYIGRLKKDFGENHTRMKDTRFRLSHAVFLALRLVQGRNWRQNWTNLPFWITYEKLGRSLHFYYVNQNQKNQRANSTRLFSAVVPPPQTIFARWRRCLCTPCVFGLAAAFYVSGELSAARIQMLSSWFVDCQQIPPNQTVMLSVDSLKLFCKNVFSSSRGVRWVGRLAFRFALTGVVVT